MKLGNTDLADKAEQEIWKAVNICEKMGYDKNSRQSLWDLFDKWLNHTEFTQSSSYLRVVVLNELTFRLADEPLRFEAWDIFTSLAEKYSEDDPFGMRESLLVSTFEIFAEPPEVSYTLELLFRLAENPSTRWAVFEAYESSPWRFRPHLHKYGNNYISESNYNEWLKEHCLEEDEFLKDFNSH